jgi:hypothetical protein
LAGVVGHENASVTLAVYSAWFNRERKGHLIRAALS